MVTEAAKSGTVLPSGEERTIGSGRSVSIEHTASFTESSSLVWCCNSTATATFGSEPARSRDECNAAIATAKENISAAVLSEDDQSAWTEAKKLTLHLLLLRLMLLLLFADGHLDVSRLLTSR